MTIRLTPGEFAATRERIAKINERAVKRGFTGRLDVTGERVEVTRTNDLGFIETKVYIDTDITGDPPGYGGWTFLARVDTEDGGLVVHGAPGAPQVDRTLLTPGGCDHCQTNRRRTKTFVVGKDGVQKQVGTTCINDFLGWEGKVVFISEDTIRDDDDLWGGGGGESAWDIDTILGVAWAVTATFGYVRTTGDYGTPTRDATFDFLTDFTKGYTRDEVDRVRALAPQARDKAREVREFILSGDFDGTSDYVQNLKTLVSGEFATHRQIGLLASAPQALIRHREQQVRREVEQAERDGYVNEWLGQIKDRLTLDVTVKAIRYIDGMYGTVTLYTMVTTDQHVVKWFSSGKGLTKTREAEVEGSYSTVHGTMFREVGETYETDAVEGDTFRITGTVKGHDEYQGQKETVLTRVKGEPIGVPA